MSKKYLFIAGCARSGTSALAELVGSHPSIVMGMERFGHLYDPTNFKARRELFKKDRFLHMEANDSFYMDFDAFHSWAPDISEKYDLAEYVGDKRPDLYTSYDLIHREFDAPIFLFIHRNIYDVAASWAHRAKEATEWPSHLDFRASVEAWNQSMELTLQAVKRGQNVIMIRYEDIFDSVGNLDSLFVALGLPLSSQVAAKYASQTAQIEQLRQRRERLPSDAHRQFIKKNARFDLAEIASGNSMSLRAN